MGYHMEVEDWEFAGLCQIGGGEGLGIGFYMFSFRSRAAGVREDVYFGGGGLAAGGSIGGASMVNLSDGQISYSSIRCNRPFSLLQFHNTIGDIVTLGASLAVGYGLIGISAYTWTQTLFEEQVGHGASAGVGLGGTYFTGVWRVGKFCNLNP